MNGSRKIWGNFLVWCVFYVFLFLILNYFYLLLLNQKAIYSRVNEDFEQYKPALEILILGDSHAQRGIYAPGLDGGFILASGAENYLTMYSRLRDLELMPKKILLSFDLHSFGEDSISKDIAFWHWQKYMNVEEMVMATSRSRASVHINSRLPLLSNGVNFLRLIFAGETNLEKGYTGGDGWINLELLSDEELNAGAFSTANRHFSNDKNVIDEILVEAFLEILSLAEKEGIEVLLVKYPVTEEYYENAGKFVDVENYYREIEDKLQGFDFEILDYHDLFWDNLSNFSDFDHLNNKGAMRFTEELRSLLGGVGNVCEEGFGKMYGILYSFWKTFTNLF
ncbi:hypothetical protein JKY72_03105 [Candidatus Gracilibacteria bacterium]|nr:hypothetical protein [Candidatus Gracilibacteria bacterium]